jgi:hypothetical protein
VRGSARHHSISSVFKGKKKKSKRKGKKGAIASAIVDLLALSGGVAADMEAESLPASSHATVAVSPTNQTATTVNQGSGGEVSLSTDADTSTRSMATNTSAG